jgi:membrane-associated protein
MDRIVDHLMALPAWAAVTLVFLLPALEASSWPGIVLPGQSAVMAGGLLASHGRAPIELVLAAAVLGAVTGPSLGYWVGRTWGPAMRERLPKRLVRRIDLARTEELLRRLGAFAVIGARFVTVLRTVVPVLSGVTHLPYRKFLLWNAIGGSVWAVGWVLMGFAAGHSAHWLHPGPVTGVLVGAAALALAVRLGTRRLLAQHG